MSPPAEKDEVSPSLAQLSLDSRKETPQQKTPKKKAKKVVADSWEDEDLSESEPEPEQEEGKEEESAAQQPTNSKTAPSATDSPFDSSWSSPTDPSSSRTTEPGKRPEKTDAVARRMIAAGLGLRAPKQTDEQKAYQKSVREQEKRKREQEKELEQKRLEDAEKAKAAMWDD